MNDFCKNSSQCREILLQVKRAIASFRCYDNPDVMIMTNFHRLSNKTVVAIFTNVCLWRRSYAQNWEALTLKNCYSIEQPSFGSTAYVAASYSPRFLLTVS